MSESGINISGKSVTTRTVDKTPTKPTFEKGYSQTDSVSVGLTASDEAHKHSDVDQGQDSQHHTLGKGSTQAAAGDHKHEASDIEGLDIANLLVDHVKSGEDSVVISFVNSNVLKAIVFTVPFPVGVIPKILVSLRGPIPADCRFIYSNNPTNTGFQVNALNTFNTTNVDFTWVALDV